MLTLGFNRWGQMILHFGTSPVRGLGVMTLRPSGLTSLRFHQRQSENHDRPKEEAAGTEKPGGLNDCIWGKFFPTEIDRESRAT